MRRLESALLADSFPLDYDLCSSCHANCSAIHNPANTFTSIANISDWWPKVVCDKCNRTGIAGNRYKCNSCVDYDLCGRCYEDSDSFHEHGKPAFSNLGSRGEDRARKIEHLKAMGFGDERTNELLLNRFDNDIQRVGGYFARISLLEAKRLLLGRLCASQAQPVRAARRRSSPRQRIRSRVPRRWWRMGSLVQARLGPFVNTFLWEHG